MKVFALTVIVLLNVFLENSAKKIVQQFWKNLAKFDLNHETVPSSDCAKTFDQLASGHNEFLSATNEPVENMADIKIKGKEAVLDNQLWPSPTIPVVVKKNKHLTKARLANLTCAMEFFHKRTCIRFQKRNKTVDHDYVTILPRYTEGCSSDSIGRLGGKQVVELGTKECPCWNTGTIIHELMHAIGFYHEHARSDRDAYVSILYDNVPHQLVKQFEINRAQQLFPGLGYEYSSIMHYPAKPPDSDQKWMTAKKGKTPEEKLANERMMGNRKAPTDMDMEKINTLYKCTDNGKTIEKNGDMVIFDEQLATEWDDWSWNATVKFDHSPGFLSEKAILADFYDQHGALNLRFNNPIDMNHYDQLQFFVKSETEMPLRFGIWPHAHDFSPWDVRQLTVTTSKSDWDLVQISGNLLGNSVQRITFQNTPKNGKKIVAAFDMIKLKKKDEECVAQQQTKEHIIYSDYLEPGWGDWSWDTKVNLAAESAIDSRAIEISFSRPWAALSLRRYKPIKADQYKTLDFMCQCPACTGTLQVGVRTSDNGPMSAPQLVTCNSQWKGKRVLLSQMGNPKHIKKIFFQNTGTGKGRFLIDNIELGLKNWQAGATVGGSPVLPGGLPNMARLVGGSCFCGGSLIGKKHVLTAADCVTAKCNWPTTVQLGSNYACPEYSPFEQIIAVKSVKTHPLYNAQTQSYNFALIELMHKAQLNKYVALAELATNAVTPGRICKAASWGQSRGTLNGQILQQVTVPIIANNHCTGKMDHTMLCGGFRDSRQRICFADSGGPLMWKTGKKWVQQGVLSSVADDCAKKPNGNRYAKVTAALPWIIQSMS